MIPGEIRLNEGVATLERQKAVLAEMMMVDADGKLQYLPEITEGSDVQNMHQPLSELNDLFGDGWRGIFPPAAKELLSIWQEPQFQVNPVVAGRHDVCVVENFNSSPPGLFASLEVVKQISPELTQNIQAFERTLAKMDEVLLLGAVSPHAIYSTAVYLESKGFHGNLVATDLSPVPINLALKLHSHFPFAKNLTLELATTDATTNLNDQLGERRFGLVITDILGYYLNPQQYNWATTNIDSITKLNSYWLTRELTEPFRQESGRSRNVGIASDEEQRFLHFLRQFFPQTNYSLEEISNFLAHRWSNDTVVRKDPVEYIGENAMNSKLMAHICTAPSKESVRVFETFLYKKRSVRFL